MPSRFPPALVRRALAASVLGIVACSDSTTGPGSTTPTSTVVVDASQNFAYLKLGDPASVVSVSDPTTSSAWDMAFFATSVSLNGGQAGPGGVSGYCLCENATATDAQVEAYTSPAEQPMFDSVSASAIPPDADFSSDQLAPAISDWFTGSGASATPVSTRTFIIRTGDTSVLLAKLHVTAITAASASNAGQVTFEYAIQSAPGSAFGAPQTVTVDTRSGPAFFAFGGNGSASNWDLRFSGFLIQLNGGASGSGTLSAIYDPSTGFDNIDATYAESAPPEAYRSDDFSGVFAVSPWYRYNITGTDNQIWPVYNVYLIKRGSDVYKVQLVGYYGTDGSSRKISVRYAKIR